jgi:hypothetical protein
MADSRITPKATHELRSFAVMHNSLIQCCLGYSHTLTFHRDVVIAKDFGESKNAAYYEICGKLSEEDSLIWIKETNHATCFHLALGASFWRTMMYTLKGIIIIVTIITGSSLAMALNGPATSGQPSVAASVAGNPAALQHVAQSTPGGVKSGSASNRQKHKHGKYKKTSG